MRSRIVGVCLSGYAYGVRTSLAFAFPWAAKCGTIRHSPETSTRGGRDVYYTARARGGGGHRHGFSLPSSAAAGEVEVEMGQDSGEMFDVFLGPESLSRLTEPPRPAGFRKARGLVHADGDWHRSVHIWLHTSKGELVLQKRSASKDTFPGLWDVSVGGHVTAGEGSLETAIKETREELGLSCDETSFCFVCTVATTAKGSTPMHGDFLCNEYKDIYLLRHDGPVEELNFAPSEVEDVKLVPMDQLREAFESQDPTYIPRPDYYIEPLFAALKEAV
ncbi:unnamed protein product [Pylaiella littoralis]